MHAKRIVEKDKGEEVKQEEPMEKPSKRTDLLMPWHETVYFLPAFWAALVTLPALSILTTPVDSIRYGEKGLGARLDLLLMTPTATV
jgi:hypothetical protein